MKNRFLPALALVAAFVLGAIVGPPQAAFAASNYGFSGTTALTAAAGSNLLTAANNGTVYTNRGDTDGAGATLPAPYANGQFLFIVQAAQTFTIATETADTLITYNDVDADSVASNTIGAAMWCWCDGTSWYLIPCTVGVTYTVND